METCRKSIPSGHAGRLAVALLLLVNLNGCATWWGSGAVDPLSSRERLNLGVSHERNGALEQALREYEQVAAGATESMALTYEGNIYAAWEDIAMAEEKYRAALAVDEDNVTALKNLAWLLAKEGRSLNEAEVLIRRALLQEPEPREPYENTLRRILEMQ